MIISPAVNENILSQIANRTIFTADNLDVLRGMDSETVDLIYLDPPFNSKRHYAAPIGGEAAGAEFKDAWTFEDTKNEWWGELSDTQPTLYTIIHAAGEIGGESNKAYLIYMTMRLIELERILKPTGSVYLHCDPTMSHPLKLLMDAVFDVKNFRNEIVWSYRKLPNHARHFQKNHDTLLFYAISDNYIFHRYYEDYTASSKKTHAHAMKLGYNINYKKGMVTVFDAEKYRQAADSGSIRSPERLKAVPFAGKGVPLRAVWELPILSPRAKERLGYPTQKPRALLERIISVSSKEGDLVLDPFCGCATTCIAAEKLNRRWIGIDISRKSAELIRLRHEREIGGLFELHHRYDLPTRSPEQLAIELERKRKTLPRSSPQDKRTMYGEQEGFCYGCGEYYQIRQMNIDHIIPQARGGSDESQNLQLLCHHCNVLKSDNSMGDLRRRLLEKNIFIDELRTKCPPL